MSELYWVCQEDTFPIVFIKKAGTYALGRLHGYIYTCVQGS